METLEQKKNRLKRNDIFNKMKELNKKRLNVRNMSFSNKNINTYKENNLPKNQKEFIDNKKLMNIKFENNKKITEPEFINISSMKPENQLIIKNNLEDVYNDGDLVLKDIIKNEFNKIDEEFKKNLLTIMTLRDYDIVNSEFVNDNTFKRFVNVNFPDLKKQLKEKYSNLDVKEFIYFIKNWYKDPRQLSIKEAILEKYQNFKNEISDLKKKLRLKKTKYYNNPQKLKEYEILEAKLEYMEENMEDKKEVLEKNDNVEELGMMLEKDKQQLNKIGELISISGNTDDIQPSLLKKNKLNVLTSDKDYNNKYNIIKKKFRELRDRKFIELQKKWENKNFGVDNTKLFLKNEKSKNDELLQKILNNLRDTNFNFINNLLKDFKIINNNKLFLNKEQMKESLIEFNDKEPHNYEKHKILLDIDDILQFIYQNQLLEDINDI